jgi:hypothetical protein
MCKVMLYRCIGNHTKWRPSQVNTTLLIRNQIMFSARSPCELEDGNGFVLNGTGLDKERS